MRVVFPAVLDGFACGEEDCVCRASLRAAALATPANAKPVAGFPFRQAEQALVAGAARLGETGADAGKGTGGALFGDYPIVAIKTPTGVELTFASLCPAVRLLLAGNEEPVSLAGSEDGWRVPLSVFHHEAGLKEIRLTPRRLVRWPQFTAMRDVLLDLIAEPTHPLLARLAQVAAVIDVALTDHGLPTLSQPLTARGFLAFRGFIESRAASVEAEPLAAFAARALPLVTDATGVGPEHVPALLDALSGDWRAHAKKWLVPAEKDIASAIEAYLGARLFSIPVDRDQSLARGYTEFFEGFAVGLRLAAAMGEVLQQVVDVDVAVAALAIGEHAVSAASEPLPMFEMPRDASGRGPRMADLDMTLESIC